MALAAPSKNDLGTRQFNLRLRDEHAVLLARVADSLADGSKSAAVGILLDLYGGKILERAQQDRDAEAAVVLQEVVAWKTPKISVELIAYLSGLVRAGNMPEVAFQLAGVPPRLRSNWTKHGRKDRAEDRSSLYADLVTAIERAEAECEAEDIARLRAHGRTTWTALAWRLERQYPDRYAQRKRIDGKVQHSVFPVVDWDRLTPQETRTLVELLRKASPEIDEPGIGRLARPAAELVPADVIDGEALDEDDRPLGEAPRLEAPALEKPAE